MKQKTLILNQDYSPLTVCNVKRAFVLVYLKKVELVQPYELFQLNTVSASYVAPAVVRIFKYVNVPYKGVSLTRQNLFKRDGFSCQYCGTNRDLTLDHVTPRAKGGKTNWMNLVTACRDCNTRKGDLSPTEAGMRLRQQPFRPSFVLFLRDLSGFVCEEWQPFLRGARMTG